MILKKLLESLDNEFQIYGEESLDISNLADDSRMLKKDGLFVAISGLTVDGHNFIDQAVNNGAVAVVGEKRIGNLEIKKGITYIQVPNSRKALSLLASGWWGNPSKKMNVVGVTGTDGKTTTSSIIYWLLRTAGLKAGLISSVSVKLGEREVDTGFHVTNPEPIALQSFLSDMVKSDIEYAVIEVTSHGLDQERVHGIQFNIGVLTNITPEHLDYHKSMEKYIRAKAKLFKYVKTAVLNKLDSSYEKIKKLIPGNINILSYPDSNLSLLVRKAINRKFSESYNRFNAEAACLVVKELGVKESDMIKGISTFPTVPGRLEELTNGLGLKIYIDFAHTPNALKNVLSELRKRTKGKLISVFGCASERDIQKRPKMGKISTDIADLSVVTSEDPRKESPIKIIDEIVGGIKDRKKYYKISERGEAITFAIQKLARKGDVVVICGKGHEKSMAYDGKEYPWSDHKAVELALKGKVLEIKR